MNTSTLAAAALALVAFTGTASAEDTLSTRAMNALGVAIASQGDAALLQVRQELQQSALEAMKPFLPQPEQAHNPQLPAETSVAQR